MINPQRSLRNLRELRRFLHRKDKRLRGYPSRGDLVTPRDLPLPVGVEGDWPVYPLLWHPIRTRVSREAAPGGRVVAMEYTWDYQPSEAAFQESLGPNDVVWVPLYQGTINCPAKRIDDRLPEYEANMRAIAELGPQVRAILVGNANAEIVYKVGRRREEWERCVRFVEEHGPYVARYGRPAFAPIIELLIYDCYRGDGRLRDLFTVLDALVLSYAGATWLFESQKRTFNLDIPEAAPYPTFAAYLRTFSVWSGVGLQRGLDAGSGPFLRDMGYEAGFMGFF